MQQSRDFSLQGAVDLGARQAAAQRRQQAAKAAASGDQAAVDAALAAMLSAARSGANMIPSMLDAARAEATLGEICGVLRQEWGSYSEAPAF